MVERVETKSRSSTRVIDLDDDTTDVLATWSAQQTAERALWGQAWVDTGHVFTSEDGEPVHADHVAQRFERLVRRAPDVPAIRFHDLRHTHASLLLAAGVPVLDMSRRIGHASAAVTLNVYAHVVPGQGRKAANTFANLLDDQGDGQS
jgi:integrase